MRILVTADVHLAADHPERLAALKEVLRIGRAQNVDALLIAGDLFDAGVDIDAIKPALRELFSENAFRTFVIPGNHDAHAFRREDHFGDDIEVLAHRPHEQRDLGAVNLLAVPFVDCDFGELTEGLYEDRIEDAVNVLMLHGTLSTSRGDAFGTEERYLPFTPEQLLETGADYVFAGHIHSSATKRTFGDDACVFACPGSPVSITQKETGRRGVWIVDVDRQIVRHEHVDAPYYVRERVDLSPGEGPERLAELDRDLDGRDLALATLLIEPSGFIEMDEGEFFAQLERIAEAAGARACEIDRTQVESAAAILESSLYRDFERKLREREDVETRAVREIVLQAFSREGRS